MNLTWTHILLDPIVYARAGTYRVARVPGGITAFPTGRQGSAEYAESWSPTEISSGLVPDAERPIAYYYVNPDGHVVLPGEAPHRDARGFRFAFWSCQFVSGRWGRYMERRPQSPDVVRAVAYFVWDFASGPGGHAVYLDAFHTDTGHFLQPDFVSVTPDAVTPDVPEGVRTREANNGRLSTEAIEETTITANRQLLVPFYDLRFSAWELAYAPIEAERLGLLPEENENTLTVRRDYLGYEFAFYRTEQVVRVSKPAEIMRFSGTVISGQAGGPVLVINLPPGFGPGGPEPGDTYFPGVEESQAEAQRLQNQMISAIDRRTERRNASLAFAAMFFALATAAAITSAVVPSFRILFIVAAAVFAALGTATALRPRSRQDQ